MALLTVEYDLQERKGAGIYIYTYNHTYMPAYRRICIHTDIYGYAYRLTDRQTDTISCTLTTYICSGNACLCCTKCKIGAGMCVPWPRENTTLACDAMLPIILRGGACYLRNNNGCT